MSCGAIVDDYATLKVTSRRSALAALLITRCLFFLHKFENLAKALVVDDVRLVDVAELIEDAIGEGLALAFDQDSAIGIVVHSDLFPR